MSFLVFATVEGRGETGSRLLSSVSSRTHEVNPDEGQVQRGRAHPGRRIPIGFIILLRDFLHFRVGTIFTIARGYWVILRLGWGQCYGCVGVPPLDKVLFGWGFLGGLIGGA